MNKMILGTQNRGAQFISILIAVVLIALSYVIAQNMSSPDMKVLFMNNSASGGKVTGANLTSQNTRTPLALGEGENIGRIPGVPNECLGSALCPD
jgi:flagellar biosynthesis/type III secretory pathway M-ring protein FliF/YscJ